MYLYLMSESKRPIDIGRDCTHIYRYREIGYRGRGGGDGMVGCGNIFKSYICGRS